MAGRPSPKNDLSFNQDDRSQMKALGISEEQVRQQIQRFKKSSSYVRLHRPCTIGDGIQQVAPDDIGTFIALQEKAVQKGRFIQFVPASGAASRMFQPLFRVYHQIPNFLSGTSHAQIHKEDSEAKDFIRFQKGIRQFAFFEDLKLLMADHGLQVEELIRQGQWEKILAYLLTEQGLNCGELPKGLLKFHQYPSGSRTAFEEHLIEAVRTIRNEEGVCHLHFTVSPEHENAFRQLFERIKPQYEQYCRTRFEVIFSVQKHSTDTIAVDLENQPFRERDGQLLFRPGGHGALLENLDHLQGDIVYLKNIDNVTPDHHREAVIAWKKVLGGVLVKIQERVHQYLRELTGVIKDDGLFEKVMCFARDDLSVPEPQGFKKWTTEKKRDFLLNSLSRPIRVCGMVKNEGEPGGGPFWAEGRHGSLSIQIVEGVQVDQTSSEQQNIWNSSTHFNPVDLVCGLRDFQGRPFNLHRYVDSEAVFISQKSKDGRELKSLEWPGLWNGAMFHWLTVFIEVPNITFNPVKTINDLLRPGHQPK